MKLTELNPRWLTPLGHPADGVRFIAGVSFLCPHCLKQRLAVFFEPAIDPENVGDYMSPKWPWGSGPFWHRDGETFDTLTLSPSIDTCSNAARIDFPGHWHGHITNGEIK